MFKENNQVRNMEINKVQMIHMGVDTALFLVIGGVMWKLNSDKNKQLEELRIQLQSYDEIIGRISSNTVALNNKIEVLNKVIDNMSKNIKTMKRKTNNMSYAKRPSSVVSDSSDIESLLGHQVQVNETVFNNEFIPSEHIQSRISTHASIEELVDEDNEEVNNVALDEEISDELQELSRLNENAKINAEQ